MTPRPLVHRAIEGLVRLAAWVETRREALAAEAGLTVAQWEVLEEIASAHRLPGLVARRRGCSPAAVSKLLRALEEEGLVRAEPAAEDGRRRRYALTARGRARMRRLRAARERAIREVWATLPEAELRAFVRVTDRLDAGLARLAGAPDPPGAARGRPPVPAPREGGRPRGAPRGRRRPGSPAGG